MKVEGRNRLVSSRGLLLNLGVAAYTLKDLRLAKQNLERSLGNTTGQSLTAVFDRLRQPDYLVKFSPRLNGFASLPRDRFAFIGCNHLRKSLALRTKGERSY